MKNEERNNEFLTPPNYDLLGIPNLSQKISSYPKWLNNNHHFAYDDNGIYFVDKLHLTFSTDYQSPHFTYLNQAEWEYNSSYQVHEFISLQKTNNRRVDFEEKYLIVVSGMSFGDILVYNTKNKSRIQIELANRFLYTQSSFNIIDNLNKIAFSFDLEINNISKYELAMDGLIDMYNNYSMIHWQSDFCPSQVHIAHNSQPIYSSYGKSTYNPIVSNPKNRENGTAYIGKPKSALQIKIYSKSTELGKLKSKKNYISEIHEKHFKINKGITRVEASIDSSKVKRYGLDLFDLLNPENHIDLFYTLVDDKLKFKDLRKIIWDKNNNDKYKPIWLLPRNHDTRDIKVLELKTKSSSNIYQKKERIKVMVHSFLDNEISCFTTHKFISKALNNNDEKLVKLKDLIPKAYKSYDKPISSKKRKFIDRLLKSDGHIFNIAKGYLEYIF